MMEARREAPFHVERGALRRRGSRRAAPPSADWPTPASLLVVIVAFLAACGGSTGPSADEHAADVTLEDAGSSDIGAVLGLD